MSLTIITLRLVIPPPATPARPRKKYSMGAFFAIRYIKSLKESRLSAERYTTLRPKMSDSRPYSTWNTVFPIRALVPAQDMVCVALRSLAMVGSSWPIPFWSMNITSRDMARREKVKISCFRGRRFSWSKSAVSAAC